MVSTRLSLILLLACYSVAIAGCSDSAPTAPRELQPPRALADWDEDDEDDEDEDDDDGDDDGVRDEDEMLSCAPSRRLATTKTIGPAGGTIRVGTHKLVIPPLALASNVEITATQVAGSRVQVEFQPHGLTFARDAKLVLSYEHCSVPENYPLDIVYINDTTGVEILRTLFSEGDEGARVKAQLEHFSNYAVAYRY